MISSETIEEIKEKSDIIQIISEIVPLKKKGKNYLGLCPFHSEKTPSFTVSQEKQLFHCFGCQEGGNIFGFVMKIHNLNFEDSVEFLSEKLNIKVKRSEKPDISKGEKEKYFSMLRLAAKYYENLLQKSAGSQTARQYLAARGVLLTTQADFQIGSAPASWDQLYKYLTERGIPSQDLEKAGLIISKNDGSYYDRFRNRIIFPIFDLMGRIVGLGGRSLDQGPKYLNSPESPIYFKGSLLYGLNFAKDEVKKTGTIILVEGYLDLIACQQAGFKNSAATLGTALTSRQAKLLKSYAQTVILAFDSDLAGSEAAARSVDILRILDLNVKVVRFEKGKDPDEYLKIFGPEKFKANLASALPWIQYKIETTLSKYNLVEIEDKSKALEEIAWLLQREKDEILKNEYIKLAAQKLKLEAETIRMELKRQSYYLRLGKAYDQDQRKKTSKPESRTVAAERFLIKLALNKNENYQKIIQEINFTQFTSPSLRNIFEFLSRVDFKAAGDPGNFVLENLPEEKDKKELTKILVSEFGSLDESQTLTDCINTIKNHHIDSRIKEIKNQIAQAEKEGNLASLNSLYEEFNAYTKKLIKT